MNIILVYAFWNAIFPALFCAACTTVIYVFDGHPLETSSTMYSPLLPPDGVKAEELTIRKLTWKNPTMREKFEEARAARGQEGDEREAVEPDAVE